MALLNLGDDPWLVEHESCEKLYRDIMEQLMQRERLPRKSDKYAHLSATVRLRLKQYSNEVDQLNHKLNSSSVTDLITAAEYERRSRQIEMLRSKSVQMQRMFDEQVSTKALEDRNRLIGDSNFADWGPSNSRSQIDASNYSVENLRVDQKKMLGEQEEGLENLSQIISRQKNIAHTISNEVDLHNEILDDLGTRIDGTDNRVRTETQHISTVASKDKTCIYWVTIILLFLSIIVVAAI